MQIGLLGKANVGKSTFFSAATETPVQIGNFPFTTIQPNVGIAYVNTTCACKHFKIEHRNPLCVYGTRFIPVKLVDVNKEAIKAGMPKRDDSIDVDVELMQELLKGMLTEKSLIVGHLAVYVISKTRVSKAIVLRKNPYDLIQVYEKRNYTDEKKNDNLGSEVLGTITYDSIKKFGNDKTFQVNTTSLTTEQTVKKIVGIVCDNSDGDTVDWLTEISKKNDFKKFFPD